MAIKGYNTGSVSGVAVPALALKTVLYRAPAFERFSYACSERKLQEGTSASIVLTRWLNPAVNTNPEPDGTTPVFRTPTYENYTGTMNRYSEVFAVSMQDYKLSPWDAVEGSIGLLVDLIKRTREQIRFLAATSGTNILYNTNAISVQTSVNGPLTLGRVQTGVAGIQRTKGVPFTKDQMAVDKFNTTPAEAGYYFFHHTDMIPDIRAFPDLIPFPELASREGLPPGAWAMAQNVIFIAQPEIVPVAGGGGTNSAMRTTNSKVDVYQSFLCAKDALTSIALEGAEEEGFGNAEIEVLDQPDKSDPTNARVLVSAAWFDLCVLTSYDWGVQFQTGATANPA
jgi:N4-gp56 family major capsid protein